MGNTTMELDKTQTSVKAQRNSLLGKIFTIVFLPIIIMVWMTGWTLMQIGSRGKSKEVKQKTTDAHPEFEEHDKSEKSKFNEDTRITNEPQIAA